MNWEDERWVKRYTRVTVDDALLSWEARALWNEIFPRLDSAGVLDFGRHGWRGIAALIGMPAEVVERVAPELLVDGRLVEREGKLVNRNYIEAQKARQSDKLRQQESRAKRRALALVESQDVTGDEGASQDVTNGHSRSQGVTSCHPASPDVTSRREEKRVEETRVEELSGGSGQTTPPATPPKKRSGPDPDKIPESAHLFAQVLADYVMENSPGCTLAKEAPAKRARTLLGWADTIRLMHERDGHGWGEISAMIGWSQKHEFWAGPIQGAKSLRKHWDKMAGQRQTASSRGISAGDIAQMAIDAEAEEARQ